MGNLSRTGRNRFTTKLRNLDQKQYWLAGEVSKKLDFKVSENKISDILLHGLVRNKKDTAIIEAIEKVLFAEPDKV